MEVLVWLENSSIAQLVRQSLYPLAQIVHILSFSLLVGAIAIFDLRLLGYARRLPIYELAKSNLPLARIGFVFVLISGIFLSKWSERTPVTVKRVVQTSNNLTG
jgi:hypothetical protein